MGGLGPIGVFMTIYGHTFFPYNSVIFGPIPNFLYSVAQEMIIYQIGYFLGGLGARWRCEIPSYVLVIEPRPRSVPGGGHVPDGASFLRK